MRSRQIRPGLFENERLGSKPGDYALAFIGLWMLADREGRFQWRPDWIKCQIFPYREVKIQPILDYLINESLIAKYEVAGKVYGLVVNLKDNQNIHKDEAASKLPPPENLSGSIENLSKSIVTQLGSGDGRKIEIALEKKLEIAVAEEKKEVRPLVFLSESELGRLYQEMSPNELDYWLNQLAEAAGRNKKKWKSEGDHNLTLRAWRRMRQEKGMEWSEAKNRYQAAPDAPKMVIYRQETNVDRAKAEGLYGRNGNTSIDGFSSRGIPAIPHDAGSDKQLAEGTTRLLFFDDTPGDSADLPSRIPVKG